MNLPNAFFLGILFCSLPLHAQTQPDTAEARRAAAIGTEIESFTGADGKVYRDVRITRIDDGGISIRHASGTARLRYGDLTSAQRQHYGLDREDALATYLREALTREKYEQAVAEKEKQRAAETAERQKGAHEAAAKLAEARRIALINRENRELSTSIPSNPPVSASQAIFPQRTTRSRGYSGYGYYPYYRPYYSPRSFSCRYGFSYRSPHFNIIIR
ncbi:MAG: hypothetical protein ABJQ29_09150 [Luteolibacter sp.]